MKILVIPDIHGRHEAFTNAIEKFENEGYDVCIQLGDLSDSFDRTNEDILRCFRIANDAKAKHGDKYIQLIGNHELHYMYGTEYRCSGFRPELAGVLTPYLQEGAKDIFQLAYQYKNYLFIHAGVQRKWFNKYKDMLGKYAKMVDKDILNKDHLADILNAVNETGDRYILHEVGIKRGGGRNSLGGPTWCDHDEMCSYGPLARYHQIVGHTPQKFIKRVEKFEGDKHYNNTSVTFTDVLSGVHEQFYTLEIPD